MYVRSMAAAWPCLYVLESQELWRDNRTRREGAEMMIEADQHTLCNRRRLLRRDRDQREVRSQESTNTQPSRGSFVSGLVGVGEERNRDVQEDAHAALASLLRPERVLVDDAAHRQKKSRPCEISACGSWCEWTPTPERNMDAPVPSDHNHPRHKHHYQPVQRQPLQQPYARPPSHDVLD